ncbi:MAG: molybdopterin-binding protein [Polyangiaceae bacterium]
MQTRVFDTAAALLIGNELLSGKVHEANLVELAKLLRAIGVELRRVVMIPDQLALIAREVRELSATHDVVFTSGGVGPTHDDVTLEGVARAFDVEIRVDESMAALLGAAYGERLTDDHLRMAWVPEGADLMTTEAEKWPTVVMKNVWVLPGVPQIFRSKLGVVRQFVRGRQPFVSRAALTQVDEATLKPWLDEVVERFPDVDVGSYPKWFDPTHKTKITFDSRDGARVEAALAAFLELLPSGGLVRVE